MKMEVKKVLACCLILAMCLCNLPVTTITSQAAVGKATSIKLNAASKTLTVGQTYQLKVKKVKPSKANKSVTWKSSNSNVAKVSSKGKVTAKKAGKATITAVSKTNKKVKTTCKITVYSKPTKVSLNYSTKEIKTAESFQLKATVSPKKAKQTVTYSSSNSKIATVNKSGKVTGKKEGKVTITVVSTTNKSKKAKCVVYVSGGTGATATPNATKAPTSVPTATKVPTVTNAATVAPTAIPTGEPTVTNAATVAPTTIPTVTSTPTITETPGNGNSGSDTYAGLSGPRTDAEGNVTYDCVYFGSYPQSDATGQTQDPIKWRILSINGTEAFLVADQNLDVYQYNEEYTDVTWETSTIRSWLNGYGSESNVSGKDYSSDNFINKAFTAAEQEAIPYVTVVNEDNPEYSTEGGNDTLDKIYLLSIAEVSDTAYGFLPYEDENGDVIDDNTRKRTNTAYVAAGGAIGSSYMYSEGSTNWWWLRSPGHYGIYAAGVFGNGDVYRYGHGVDDCSYAVCPALHLNLSSTDVWSNAGTITIERE